MFSKLRVGQYVVCVVGKGVDGTRLTSALRQGLSLGGTLFKGLEYIL